MAGDQGEPQGDCWDVVADEHGATEGCRSRDGGGGGGSGRQGGHGASRQSRGGRAHRRRGRGRAERGRREHPHRGVLPGRQAAGVPGLGRHAQHRWLHRCQDNCHGGQLCRR
uniref:Uncharacterized protein n=1 Tax=Zea mays TaxID=4577 RepID=C4J3N5_MAIZE|nr:unknown [Zea mays]|eukprot:NP_001183127.1 uncharacterized protein LOC100501494 [Zea mays]